MSRAKPVTRTELINRVLYAAAVIPLPRLWVLVHSAEALARLSDCSAGDGSRIDFPASGGSEVGAAEGGTGGCDGRN